MSHLESPSPQPYGSARDLPSFRDMERQLHGMLQLTRLIGRKQRPQLKELRAGMSRLADTVDRFYEKLGARHWVFTGNMSVDDLAAILDEEAFETDCSDTFARRAASAIDISPARINNTSLVLSSGGTAGGRAIRNFRDQVKLEPEPGFLTRDTGGQDSTVADMMREVRSSRSSA